MIIPSWREFPGRLVRLACAALLVSTAMTVPRATVADSGVPDSPAVASSQAQ
jgi:hypothetical protein